MKIDCSKLSNKGDLMALVGLMIIATAFAVAIALAIYVNAFYAGFLSATILWKWHAWLYEPIDAWLDRLWAQDKSS